MAKPVEKDIDMEKLLQLLVREFRAFKTEILDRIASLESHARIVPAAAPAMVPNELDTLASDTTITADSDANSGAAGEQKGTGDPSATQQAATPASASGTSMTADAKAAPAKTAEQVASAKAAGA